jgi:hypothetical protein
MANLSGLELQALNHQMGGVSRSEATPEKQHEAFNNNERQSANLRSETLSTGLGDRSPNAAIQAMSAEKGSADPGVQSMLSGVSFGNGPERQSAAATESGAGIGMVGLAGGDAGGGMNNERTGHNAGNSFAGAAVGGAHGEGFPPGGGGGLSSERTGHAPENSFASAAATGAQGEGFVRGGGGTGGAGGGVMNSERAGGQSAADSFAGAAVAAVRGEGFPPAVEGGGMGSGGDRLGAVQESVGAVAGIVDASTDVDKLTALDASKIMLDAERLKPGSIPIERTEGLAATTAERANLNEMTLLDQSWMLQYHGAQTIPGPPRFDDPSAPREDFKIVSANSIFVNAQQSHLLKFENAGSAGVLDQAGALELLGSKLGVTIPDFKVIGEGKQVALLMTNVDWTDSTSPGLTNMQKQQADAIISVAAKTLKRNGYNADLHRGNWGVSPDAVKSGKPIKLKDVIIFDPVSNS